MLDEENSVMNITMFKLAILTVGSVQGKVVNVDEVAQFYIDYVGSLTKKQRVNYLENILKRLKENDGFSILGRNPEVEELMAFDAIRINVARIKHYPISISKSGELLVYEDEVIKIQKKKRPPQKKKTVIEIDPNNVSIISDEELKKQEEEKKSKTTEMAKSNAQSPRRKTVEEIKLSHKRHHSNVKNRTSHTGKPKRLITNKPKSQSASISRPDRSTVTKPINKRQDSVVERKIIREDKVNPVKNNNEIKDDEIERE